MKRSILFFVFLFVVAAARADFLTGPVTYAAELRGSGSNAFGSAFITFDPAAKTLFFEVNTSGTIGTILVDVHRGNVSEQGDAILQLAFSDNGRASGGGDLTKLATGALTDADLAALANLSEAGGYFVNVHSTAFPAGEIRGKFVAAQEVDIPVAGHVTNGLGQTFISDARIFNPSMTAATTALVEFFPAGTDSISNAASSLVVNLPPRGTAVLDDVVSGLNLRGTGAIRISIAASTIATSRVYVRTLGGSFGQFVPAFSRNAALRQGAIPQVSNVAQPLGFPNGLRANLGFFNPNPSPATVRLELREANGALLGANTITLGGLSQQQNGIAAYFPEDVAAAANLTVTFDSTWPVFAYVSEVDNISGDSFLVPAQSDAGINSLSP